MKIETPNIFQIKLIYIISSELGLFGALISAKAVLLLILVYEA